MEIIKITFAATILLIILLNAWGLSKAAEKEKKN